MTCFGEYRRQLNQPLDVSLSPWPCASVASVDDRKRMKTIGRSFCFSSFCCYGWHVLSIAATPTMSHNWCPPTVTTPPFPFPSGNNHISSSLFSFHFHCLCFTSLARTFRYSQACFTSPHRIYLSCCHPFGVSFPQSLCTGLFSFFPSAQWTGASTDTCFTVSGWVGSGRRFWVSGTRR